MNIFSHVWSAGFVQVTSRYDKMLQDFEKVCLPAAIAACCASPHSHSHQPENNNWLDIVYKTTTLPSNHNFTSMFSHLVFRVCQLCKSGDGDGDCLVVSCHFLSHRHHIPLSFPPIPLSRLPAPRWRPQLANSSDAQLVGRPAFPANPGRSASLATHQPSGNYAAHVKAGAFCAWLHCAFL